MIKEKLNLFLEFAQANESYFFSNLKFKKDIEIPR